MAKSEPTDVKRSGILSPRINLLFGLLSLLVAASITAAIHALFLLAVRDLEAADLRKSHTRLVAGLRQELVVLDTTCRDWAFWKDMYDYVRTQGEKFESDNLTEAGLRNTLGLDLMGIFNREGELIWLGFWERRGKETAPETVADFLKELMSPKRRDDLSGQRQGTAGMAGFLRAPWGWTLVAARPILPGQEAGEPIGFLLMGRRADERWKNRVVKQLGLSYELVGPEQAPRPGFQKEWRWNTALSVWQRTDREKHHLLFPLRTVWPGGLLVELIYPRELMGSARRTARSVSVILFASILSLFLGWMWVLRRQVRELQRDRLRMEQELKEKSFQTDQMREQALALLNNADQLRQRLERIAAEQRQISAQMQEAATRARVLFENVPLATLLISPVAGVIIQANRSAADLYAASSPDDLLAHHPVTLSPLRQPDGEESARRWKEWERDSALPRGVTFPWRCRRLDGTEFDAEVTAVAFDTADRRLLAVFIRPTCGRA